MLSLVGQFRPESFGQRPYRQPHHTASAVALVGGGNPPRPGEISLAHQGVLFLDELPEFDRKVLETLREPLESGRIHIARAARQAEFPAEFQLIAAMNPVPLRLSRPRRTANAGARRTRLRAIAANFPALSSIASTCSSKSRPCRPKR